MLQAIRDRAQGMLAWIILVLIVIPFAFWGIENYFDVGQRQPVAEVGDRQFFEPELSAAYQERLQRIGNRVNLTPQVAAAIRRQTLEQMIQEEVLRQAAAGLGLAVSDSALREFIRDMPEFQGDRGFDNETYKRILALQGMSPIDFAQRLKQILITKQFMNGVMDSGFVTEQEMDRYYRLRDQKRRIEYVVIPPEETKITVSEAEVEKYYQENRASFRNPERVSVDYLELNVEDLAREIEVKDSDLLGYYEENKDLYTKEGKRRVSHILFALPADADPASVQQAEATARRVLQRLEQGEDFAKLAEEMSEDAATAKTGGDLGLIQAGEMVKPFEDAAFSLKEGEVSAPVRTQYGIHLIKLTEFTKPEIKSFDEVREEVKRAYQREATETRIYELAEKLAELSYENPDSLEHAAQSLGLKIKKSEWFTRAQGEGIGAEAGVRQAAFSDEVLGGSNSELIEISADHLVVLRINERQRASNRSLEEVRDEIVARLKAKMAAEQAEQRATALWRQIEAGAPLSPLAETAGLRVEKPASFGRVDSQLPPSLVVAAFQARRPQGGQGVPLIAVGGRGERYLGVLLEVIDGNPNEVETQQRDTERKRQASLEALALFTAFKEQLRDQADVAINLKAEEEP